MRDPVTQTVKTLIIGSGAAGLNAALCLWDSGVKDILIVTERWGGGTSNNAGSDKQTYYKLSLDPGVPDSALEMAGDLCRGGAMHGDIALIEAQHSVQAFYNLVRLGVPFPCTQYGSYPGYKTDHDPRARATSTGPLTSHLMFQRMAEKVIHNQIPVQDEMVIIGLLTRETPEGRAVAGAVGIDVTQTNQKDQGLRVFLTDNVILATGGPAGIYRDSVYPVSQIGSIGIALKAGARAQNLALSQFGIASVKFRWNLSGSYQQVIPRYYSTGPDNNDRTDFIASHFPDAKTCLTAIFLKGYQWPFDPQKVRNYGSSYIDILVQHEITNGRKVFVDYTRNPDGFNWNRLGNEAREYLEKSGATGDKPIDRLRHLNQPAIDLFAAQGIDITSEPLEIAVCAQHNNGGLTGDIWWESNIHGLFPIGEVNGSHGNTRPGGSALNSGQVGGIRSAMRICNRLAASGEIPDISDNENGLIISEQIATAVQEIRTSVRQLLAGTGTLHFKDALTELQARMSDHGGAVRNPDTIGEQADLAWQLWSRMNCDLQAVNPGELVDALRTLDLCLTHAVYLECIADDLHSKADKRSCIQEVMLDDQYRADIRWTPVRPVPQEELWFEKVWKEFRSDNAYKNKT